MRTMMFRRALLALTVVSGPAWAETEWDFPSAALQPYSEFRAQMIAAGWTPTDISGSRGDLFRGNTEAFNRYEEISCNFIPARGEECAAEWTPPPNSATWIGDKPVTIEIQFSRDDPANFRVRPEYRSPE